MRRGVEQLECVLEPVELVDVRQRAGTAQHDRAERRRGDHAREPHAAEGRREQLGIVILRDLVLACSGGAERERGDVPGDAARVGMVLAVHVRGDRAADGEVCRTRHDGKCESVRGERFEQLGEGRAGTDADLTGSRVDRSDATEPRHVEHRAVAVLRRIAVAAPGTSGDQAAHRRLAGQQLGDLPGAGRPQERHRGRVGASPAAHDGPPHGRTGRTLGCVNQRHRPPI